MSTFVGALSSFACKDVLMAGKKTDIGPSAQTAAVNLKRLREAKNLTYTELSKRLAAGGRAISPLAVRRMEEGERRMDVDDLMSLSIALDVSPTYFLMPATEVEAEDVTVTGKVDQLPAKQLYEFLHGEHSLAGKPVRVREWVQYLMLAAPGWRIDEAENALRTLSDIRLADEWKGQENEIPGRS